MKDAVLRIGMIGIGGIGKIHLETIRTLHHLGQCRLTAVADPTAGRFPETLAVFEWEGVDVYDDYRDLIARSDVDAVIIATPIHLHVSQTRDSLAAGKHVYLEKPPCPTLEEYELLEADWRASGKVCAVGFQMQAAPVYAFVRNMVSSGALGEISRIWAAAQWPRGDMYYNRAAWAGRMTIDGAPVFDGPAINANGHVVHAAMGLAGSALRVRGALKRARPIESYDTSFLEAETDAGVNVRIILTHATSVTCDPVMRVRGSRGEVSFDWNMNATLTLYDGPTTSYSFPYSSFFSIMVDFLNAIQRGHAPATPLSECLPFLQVVNGALKSGDGIGSFGSDVVSIEHANTSNRIYTVRGLDDEIKSFLVDPEATPTLVAPGPWLDVADIPRTLDESVAHGADHVPGLCLV